MKRREQEYSLAKKERELSLKAQGRWVCVFSGKPLTDLDWHHLDGRIGDLLFYQPLLAPALRYYHAKWHSEPLSKLMKEDWFPGFVSRIEQWYPEYHKRLLIKIEKVCSL